MSTDAKSLRDQLLSEWRAVRSSRFGPESRGLSTTARRALLEKEEELQRSYWDSLPTVPISRCPTDGALVRKRIDAFGLDGSWWLSRAPDEPPAGDPHVLTYTGALKLAGVDVSIVPRSMEPILPGPEVPYVIPRLLLIPEVKCVISSIELFDGLATAYLMTYFAHPGIAPSRGHPMWLRDMFYYAEPGGGVRWDAPMDRWDFDIAKWLRESREKIYWINSGDPGMAVHTGPAEQCPYIGIEGVRTPRSIKNGRVSELPLPEPSLASDYFD